MQDTEVVEPRETQPSGPDRRRLLVVGVLVVALVAVAWFVLRDDAPEGPTGGIVTAPDGGGTDDPVAAEPLGEAGGVILTGARVTATIDPATGRPGSAADRFAPGDIVRFWLAFDDSAAVAGRQTLFVTFTRDGEEVFRTGFRLPQPTGQQNVALGESQTMEPGTYTVTVSVDDEQLYETTFDVG